jgi:hypothetical protein
MSRGGRPPLLGAEELVQLQIALLEGPTAHGFGTPLWTLKRVRLFIERQFGVRYSDVHVWRLLGQMGFSSQKPERRALERDEAAIETWKKCTWPALKKSPPRRSIDPLCGRIWNLASANPGTNLGAEGRQPGGAVPFQLGSCVDYRGHAPFRRHLSSARRGHPQGRGRRIPQGAQRPLSSQTPHRLGRRQAAQEPVGARLRQVHRRARSWSSDCPLTPPN